MYLLLSSIAMATGWLWREVVFMILHRLMNIFESFQSTVNEYHYATQNKV